MTLSPELANFIVVLLVIAASGFLLLRIVSMQQRSRDCETDCRFVAQVLTLWLLAWGMWAFLWAAKAFFPYEEFSQNDIKEPHQLVIQLGATNSVLYASLRPRIFEGTNENAVAGISPDSKLSAELARRLNNIIAIGPPLFDAHLFSNNPSADASSVPAPPLTQRTNAPKAQPTPVTAARTNALEPRLTAFRLPTGTLDALGTILKGRSLVSFNRRFLQEICPAVFPEHEVVPWRTYLSLGLSSLNALILFLLIYVIYRQERILPTLLWMYAVVIVSVVLLYYGLMYGLSRRDQFGGNEAFDQLILNWSVAESILAPLLLTVALWQTTKTVIPVFFGILYAFAQPIVYQVDVGNGLFLPGSAKDPILITLAFLKILLAASVLYAVGCYTKTLKIPSKDHSLLKFKISEWNTAIAILIIGGACFWYYMAGQRLGVLKAGGPVVAVVGLALKLLDLKREVSGG